MLAKGFKQYVALCLDHALANLKNSYFRSRCQDLSNVLKTIVGCKKPVIVEGVEVLEKTEGVQKKKPKKQNPDPHYDRVYVHHGVETAIQFIMSGQPELAKQLVNDGTY
mmetsp:Transcript_34983/g.76525  ORF Transcript_34983/g.76525 Transcript_34983/m.76525 type:complete len:109 (-) Transcript_34983:132-458(-)